MVQYTEWRSISDGSIISSIPDSTVYQLNALELSGFNNGDSVSTWEESITGTGISGSGTYRDSGIGGSPSVELDGTDDGYLDETLDDISPPYSLFILVEPFYDGSDAQDLTARINNADNIVSLGSGSDAQVNFRIDGETNRTSEGIWDVNEPILLSARIESGNSVGRVNKSQEVNFSESDTFPSLLFGYNEDSNDDHLEGYAGLLEVHDEALSDSELLEREEDIESLFGINV